MLNRTIAAVLIAYCAAAGFAGESYAQERYLEIATRYSRAQVFHEAIVVPNGDRREAFISFRIPNSLLVFTQEKNGFEADVDVTAELYRGGKKVDEQIWRARHAAATFEQTQSRTADLQGRLRFEVEPGSYAYRLIVNDDGSDDRGAARAFHVPDAVTMLYGSLVFGNLRRDSVHVVLDGANLGGDVPFGVNLPAILPVASATQMQPDEPVLTFRLYLLTPNRKEKPRRRPSARRSGRDVPTVVQPDPIEIRPDDELVSSGSVLSRDLVEVGPLQNSDAGCLCWSIPATSGSAAMLATLPLRTDELENGTYMLEVKPVGDGEAGRYVFGTRWQDMPLSLYDIDVAIRNLEFIEQRDTIRGLLKGSRGDKVEAFRAYWHQRDPTPGTVRNELMEEYYRRVDQAAVRFRTGQHPVPDGLRTDPARIYILYGEPDQITNTLPSSGGVEQTWTYADGRTFKFWASSSLMPMELLQ